MILVQLFILATLCLLINIFLYRLIIFYALKFNIVDRPVNSLKDHKKPIPYMGGIGIYLGVLVTIFTYAYFAGVSQIENYLVFLLILTFFMVIGLLDDLFGLSILLRLSFQLLVISVSVIYYFPKNIVIFNELLSRNFLVFVIIMLIIFFTGLVNAYNFYDNVDGALSIYFFVNILLFIFIAINYYTPLSSLLFLLCSLLVFIFLNRNPSKVFLGDAGSMVIGYVIAFVPLPFFINHSKDFVTAVSSAALFWGVPLIDFAQVFIYRTLNGINPMKGSPHHLSHRLRSFGIKREDVGIYLSVIQVAFNLIILYINDTLLSRLYMYLIVFIIFFILYKKSKWKLKLVF